MNVDSSLLRQLVSVRSDIDASPRGSVERRVAEVVERYVARHLPAYRTRRQTVAHGRHNLIVTPKVGAPDLLLIGHLDTVPLGAGWSRRPLGEQHGSKLFGRGSADMKAGVVAILGALQDAATRRKLNAWALFYADEEYGFAGMKKFTARAPARTPRLVVCPEPTNLAIRPGCRGVIELRVTVRGLAGHAARPWTGVSAFDALTAGVAAVRARCRKEKSSTLGQTTTNVTGVQCGVGQTAVIAAPANVIPDFACATIEVRPATNITAKTIVRLCTHAVRAAGGRAEVDTVIDLGSFATPRSKLRALERAQRSVLGDVRYAAPGEGGYSDVQMLAAAWRTPAVLLGPTGANMHGTDEYVELASVAKLKKILSALIIDS